MVIERVETDAFLILERVSFSALTKEAAKIDNVASAAFPLLLKPRKTRPAIAAEPRTPRFIVPWLVLPLGEYRFCPIVLLSSWQLYSLGCSIARAGAKSELE